MHPKLISDLHSDSQISSFWDDQRQKYVHHFKRMSEREPNVYRRCTARVEVDHYDDPWPQHKPIVIENDRRDPAGMDIYTNSAEKYRLAKNVYFAFPTPYYHYFHPGRQYLTAPAMAKGGKMNDGTLETQLATSRDGKNWTRYRTPYVPLCRYEEIDLYVNMVFPGLIYHDTHIDHYFCGYAFTHGDTGARRRLKGRELGGIFRIQQRIDGFISADFDYEGGVMITEPFVFEGGKPVRLRFEMRGTKLYAFQFQP